MFVFMFFFIIDVRSVLHICHLSLCCILPIITPSPFVKFELLLLQLSKRAFRYLLSTILAFQEVALIKC